MRKDMIYVDADGVVYPFEECIGNLVRFGRVGRARSRVRTVLTDVGELITVQSGAEECDINLMMERFAKGQALPEFVPAQYGDVSDMGDFLMVQNRLNEAREAFMQLPAKLRERFNNSVNEFVEFVADPKNVDEGRELGLFAPKEQREAPATEEPKSATNNEVK